MNTKPQPIPDAVKHNYHTLLKAAKNDDVALVSALTNEGKQVYLICAMNREGTTLIPIPVGEMILGNPFEMYQDPTQDGD